MNLYQHRYFNLEKSDILSFMCKPLRRLRTILLVSLAVQKIVSLLREIHSLLKVYKFNLSYIPSVLILISK